MSSSKHPTIRVSGQRSIPSTFLFRSSNRPIDGKEDGQSKAPAKELRVSLSDFLNRKLQKGSVLPKSVQGKQKPFSSPVTAGAVSGSDKGEKIGNKRGEPEFKCSLDVAFEQLKNARNEKEDCVGLPADGEVGSSSTHDMHVSRKRSNPFEGGDEKQSSRKVLVVLGDNPKIVPNARKSFIRNEKSKPLYNHYANGCGWWDNNREGVDSDEVGCNEVWEGVGSTTLGGLEWH